MHLAHIKIVDVEIAPKTPLTKVKPHSLRKGGSGGTSYRGPGKQQKLHAHTRSSIGTQLVVIQLVRCVDQILVKTMLDLSKTGRIPGKDFFWSSLFTQFPAEALTKGLLSLFVRHEKVLS